MFRLVKILNGRTNQAEPMVMATNSGEAYEMGEALCLSNGVLTCANKTAAPTYISICDMAADQAEKLPVYPVSQSMVFECPVTGDTSSLTIGEKVTLADDGMGVTTTAGGSATILSLADEDNLVLVTF